MFGITLTTIAGVKLAIFLHGSWLSTLLGSLGGSGKREIKKIQGVQSGDQEIGPAILVSEITNNRKLLTQCVDNGPGV